MNEVVMFSCTTVRCVLGYIISSTYPTV